MMRQRGTRIFVSGISAGLAAVAAGPVLAQQSTSGQTSTASGANWSTTIDTETRIFNWSSNRGSPALSGLGTGGSAKGQQVNTPFAVQIEGKPNDDVKVEMMARGGYIWSRQLATNATGVFLGQADGMTDTTFGGTFTYMGIKGIQPFVSLNVNAPTGASTLRANKSGARLDQDVAGPPTFGVGWNIGPTVGVNIPITKQLMWSVGAGHTYRGSFEREGALATPAVPQGLVVINPGDVTTFNTSLAWKGEKTTVQAQVSYSYETRTTVDEINFYRSGTRLLGSVGLQHTWTDEITTRFTGSITHTEKNDVRFAADAVSTALIGEAQNSNSSVLQVSTELFNRIGSFYVGPTIGYLYRDHNDWSAQDFQFLPGKTKWSAGAFLLGSVTEKFTVNARAERLWLTENPKPDAFAFGAVQPNTGYPQTHTDAWQVTVGGSVKF